jgi:hypothetical protein
MSTRQVLTFGFIPTDWSENQNQEQLISVGDPEASNTKEFDVEIVEDDESAMTLSVLGINDTRVVDPDEFWNNKSQLYKELSKKIEVEFGTKLKAKLLQQLWALFQDELEDDVDCLVVVAEGEEDGAEFINDGAEYKGCVYARYFSEEDDEIYGEKIVVINL